MALPKSPVSHSELRGGAARGNVRAAALSARRAGGPPPVDVPFPWEAEDIVGIPEEDGLNFGFCELDVITGQLQGSQGLGAHQSRFYLSLLGVGRFQIHTFR